MEEKIVDILVLYRDPDRVGTLYKDYGEKVRKEYSADKVKYHFYTPEKLKEDVPSTICASCFEGLYVCHGPMTKEDLEWPMVRQRPKYKKVN